MSQRSPDEDPGSGSHGRRVAAYAALRYEALSLGELEQVRLLLRGGSVIDWYRLNFERPDEVEAFVRLLGFDLDDARDRAYLEHLRGCAIDYLVQVHGYKIPDEFRGCDLLHLPLYASEAMGKRRHRMYSCILLKVMHIIHHVNARELRFRLPISDATVTAMLVRKVEACADAMRRLGFPLLDFTGGQKPRDSLIAKLLVKRDNLAIEVYDRVRFRFVFTEPSDLVPAIRYLCQHLLPFNYLVPGQTQNDLIDFTSLLRSHPLYRTYESRLQIDASYEERQRAEGPRNEFSGSSYRVINFVSDVPMPVPDELLSTTHEVETLGRSIFGLAEFQVIDAETARQNDRGDAAHHRYKARQRARERERLERGMRGRLDFSLL